MAKKKIQVNEEEVELEGDLEDQFDQVFPEVSAPKLQCLKPNWQELLVLNMSKINHSHVEKNAVNGLIHSLIYS